MDQNKDLKRIRFEEYVKRYLINRDKYKLFNLFKQKYKNKEVTGARFFPWEIPNRNTQVSKQVWIKLVVELLTKEKYN